MPITDPEHARLMMTVSCRDTDVIPKVADAGNVVGGVQIMHNSVRVAEGCYYGAWMTEVIRRLQGHHEPQEEVVFHAIVERLASTATAPPTVLELGSFWAYYSLWVLHRIPDGQAFLVEPDPNNLVVGQRNFDLNGMKGVFLQAAVGSSSAPPSPFRCESDGLERLIAKESLASLLDRFGLERADIVLADVQGAELPLLEGAQAILSAGRVRFLVVSTHHHSISNDPLTHQRCLDLLRSVGAHVIAEHSVAESYSGDGLIAVSFDSRDRDLEVGISRARPKDSLFGDPLNQLDRLTQECKAVPVATQERLTTTAVEGRHDCEVSAAVTGNRSWRIRCRTLAVLARLESASGIGRLLARIPLLSAGSKAALSVGHPSDDGLDVDRPRRRTLGVPRSSRCR